MNTLAIDTSCENLSLALSFEGQTHTFHEAVGQRHSDLILPAIRTLLDQQGVELTQLDAIVYGQGPGSFTGLRIACGIAQGLAFAAGLPLIAIPTLDCMAAELSGPVLVCLDARMHQVYCASYNTQNWQQLTPIGLYAPDEVPLPDPSLPWVGIGNGFQAYKAELDARMGGRLTAIHGDIMPRATTLLQLAESGRYPSVAADQASLLYVRNKVALTRVEQQAQRQ